MRVTIHHPGSDSEPVFTGHASMSIHVSGVQSRPAITLKVISANLETIGKLMLTKAELVELVHAAGRAIDHIEAQSKPEACVHGAD